MTSRLLGDFSTSHMNLKSNSRTSPENQINEEEEQEKSSNNNSRKL